MALMLTAEWECGIPLKPSALLHWRGIVIYHTELEVRL